MVLCLRLHFTKDSTTNNTAAAAIKHLVSIVFERVIAEDKLQPSGQWMLHRSPTSPYIIGRNELYWLV